MGIETLVSDIYSLFDKPQKEDKEAAKELGEAIASVVVERLTSERTSGYLRMSNVGKGDRQVWYDLADEDKDNPSEVLTANTKIKFLYGDIIELLLLFLAKQAGHKVAHEQAEVAIEGVVGHIDAEIDDELVDVKSASSYSWNKFNDATLLDEGKDPFGYVAQISAYAKSRGKDNGYFLVMDKTLGKLCLLEVDATDMIDPVERIKHMKEVVAHDEPPERCHDDVPDGKSGNRKLGTNCSYCSHKFRCWSDINNGQGLRTFIYSTGPRYLTDVVKLPKVNEVADA